MNELEELRAEYRGTLAAKTDAIRRLWTERKLDDLRRALHTLAGSAGTFGLGEISAAARDAETYLDACSPAMDASQQAALEQLLEAIYSRAASNTGAL